MENFTQTSDEKLYSLCKQYGEQARMWRQKFIGLLPEVFKRRLHEKKGFSSIYEFAFKLAGLSEEQVGRALNLEKRLGERGAVVLKQMFEQGEVSINKLTRVASVANGENQEFWASQVKLLPQKALETLVKDEKYMAAATAGEQEQGCGQIGVFSNSQISDQFVRAHKSDNNSQTALSAQEGAHNANRLHLSEEVQLKLLKLQQKGIDINALILEFLEKREQEIEREKEKLSAEAKPTLSRYIPVSVRQLIKKEFGTKCSVEWCHNEAEEIHHTQRFSFSRRHDPKYLAPFCEEHHAIAHSIDLKCIEKRNTALASNL